jgi:hypothetical protein
VRSTPVTPTEIASGFACAVATLCLGLYLSVKAGGEAGTLLIRIFYILAVLIVLRFTFAWGQIRGFPLRGHDGGIALSHVLRNLVMAAIVWVVLLFISAPLMSLAFDFAR